MIQQIDYFLIAPPLVLALTAASVLLLDAFLPARPRTRAGLGLVTLAGVLASLGFVVAQAAGSGAARSTFCVPPSLGGDPSLCSYVVDRFTLVFAGLVLVSAVVVVLLSMTELSGGDIPAGEWHFLLLCALIGAVTLPASRDLVMLVVALELVSLPVFALTAMKRYDGRSSEAAVKLFVVSVVSTAVMLFGVSLLYGVAGSVYLSRLSTVLAGGAPAPGLAEDAAVGQVMPAVVTVGLVLVVAGFAFKIAAVPFHSWAADVYQGAPVPVAALLSVISKAAGFAGLILVLTTALSGQSATWAPVVGVLAALTMTVGNLLALRQRSAVRLLAWSSVAQSGYVLAPLAAGTAETAGASIAYLVIYAAMNLGAFAVVMLVSRTSARNELDDYRGLVFTRPAAGIALAFCLVCLAGLPPGLAGLFAKVFVFREIVASGFGWLALVMAVNTVIGLCYYALWTARLFAPAGAQTPVAHRPRVTTYVAVGMALAAAVLFSVAPQVVLDLTSLSTSG
ncbi:NADH-quinone oxidoreductase subunit N [Nonomuraea maritima]|uniref:NADH-quinone oxidoreductase subunit N n=1 Tax=Nonomuraea maritima TaxID=683260 RepID=A0A1G9MXH6_9ACTN|nr:NADH-quinone oxidoreductase subunit N [Nonomuraea maritima]SDL78627.1 NADH-quinone oxidoreductase subunit N [Nonomuraea maritima]